MQIRFCQLGLTEHLKGYLQSTLSWKIKLNLKLEGQPQPGRSTLSWKVIHNLGWIKFFIQHKEVS